VEYCYSKGNVSGGDNNVGGVVGNNGKSSSPALVQYCYSTGAVEGSSYVGGVVGENSLGTVEYCFATGDVTATGGTWGTAGGVVANSNGGSTIRYCYSTGNVQGGRNTGGVVGRNYNNGIVQYCYATGIVSGMDYVGGLLGAWNTSGDNTVQNCVALGRSVSGDSIPVRRAVAYKATGILANIRARDDMDVFVGGLPTTETPDIATNGLDGQDMGSGDWYDELSFWTPIMGFTNVVWDFPAGKLPTLKGSFTGGVTQEPMVQL
jgi:hypothetical protein